MDKSVLPQAAIYGLLDDLHLVGQDYSWCSSLFYFGYLTFQPIGVLCLMYLPPGKFVITISILWSIILMATAAVTNFTGMAVSRFFLGAVEGGITPAYILITSAWYTQSEIPLRTVIWFCGNGLAFIVQAFISYGIGRIVSPIAVWKWFFIIYGLVALLWAVVLWWFMPDTIISCKFLDDREKAIALERIRANRTGIASPHFKMHQLREALLDVKVWWPAVYIIAWIIPNTVNGSFSTIIIKGLGFTSSQASLLNAPFGVTQVIGLLVPGYVAYRWKNMRCIMQMAINIPGLVAAIMLNTLPQSNGAANIENKGRLVALYLVNFTNGSVALSWALNGSNISGHTKRTVANAIQFVGYSTGFIVGPQFFLGTESPLYPTALKAMLVCFSITQIMPAGYYALMTWENRRKAAKLQELGRNLVEENEEFMDKTDKEQLGFVYMK
ncbi:allantoate permease [Thozetella sp. PMI_491]|nr:allantoate permease [Thozetella sp. PMI_491]